MYFCIVGGISGTSQPTQHTKLQTAFFSNINPFLPQQPTILEPVGLIPSNANPFLPQQPAFVPQPFLDPNQATQQAFYGGSSNPYGRPTFNPNPVHLNTSDLNKVSVEGAKEHMELLNTLVSSYCGLVDGQVGNINLSSEEYA
ncbi:hypothetical protein HanRHA438_Chr16g0753841 [Helianthus annuus]|nr:hypothetical protein HanIR_Chr16g0806531 [Helianthus annuus]KAJ0835315.1 hypothetical protein HanRHA438_Chr16g0753841 [Helianthus annuus]